MQSFWFQYPGALRWPLLPTPSLRSNGEGKLCSPAFLSAVKIQGTAKNTACPQHPTGSRLQKMGWSLIKQSLFRACNAFQSDSVWAGSGVSDGAVSLTALWGCRRNSTASVASSLSWNIWVRQRCGYMGPWALVSPDWVPGKAVQLLIRVALTSPKDNEALASL